MIKIGKKLFKIDFNDELNLKAAVVSIDDAGHTVTIRYKKDRAEEELGIHTFWERLKSEPAAAATTSKRTAAAVDNSYRKTYKGKRRKK